MTGIDFRTAPEHYRHWKLSMEGPVATLALDVDAEGGLAPGYELKLNSYDLGVDIELNDAIQRLRFEHPEIKSVIITSAKERVFCAGANIGMLSTASHAHKVNFCKFTNETRLALEDASAHSGQIYMCAINGPCAGGGYELALAADHLVLLDDGASAVSLPEIPLLAVLPGTGGLTRLVDKRGVRRDRADFFCTVEEGVRGKRALDWHLVDAVVPRSKWQEEIAARAANLAAASDRPADAQGTDFPPLEREVNDSQIDYAHLRCTIDRELRVAHITVRAPVAAPPSDLAAIHGQGAAYWPLALARELEDLILHLRFNEHDIGTWLLRSEGESEFIAAADAALAAHADDWLVREITLYLKRTLKRLDLSARSIFAFIEPGSCFTGTLLELALAADRSYMLNGTFEGDNWEPATIRLTAANRGLYPMANGLSRLHSRFIGDAAALAGAENATDRELDAGEAEQLGLVTFAPDDIDWQDETRIAIEERAAFSPDALTGMEASLRFAGPETMESKIFSRLTAWQNWIFQRPNAVGEEGTLKLYGSGKRPRFDKERV
ncbi:MAG: benzoyl-CoA-dihydrodiol lyase [Rhodospirillaceae bacterium]|nr:benzoyl-CoA-dihydrodiol lyase [Rhodospirillaceae bacterium]MBT5036902.1 benzoyl-CoA-dihydrodiol lyase [Rhodospirillaceae bacterium]